MNKPIPANEPDVPHQPVEPDTPLELPPEDGKTPLQLPHERDEDADMTDGEVDPTSLLSQPLQAADLRDLIWAPAQLRLANEANELHLDYPFAGSRMLQGLLRGEGLETGRLHVATLMKKMGIEAIYRRPNTSKPAPGHKIYPYLLRKLAVTRPNQVSRPVRRVSSAS